MPETSLYRDITAVARIMRGAALTEPERVELADRLQLVAAHVLQYEMAAADPSTPPPGPATERPDDMRFDFTLPAGIRGTLSGPQLSASVEHGTRVFFDWLRAFGSADRDTVAGLAAASIWCNVIATAPNPREAFYLMMQIAGPAVDRLLGFQHFDRYPQPPTGKPN